jgi:AraC-like DNA-binding protein
VNQLWHPILCDFITRVHKCKLENSSSFAKACCDYINLYIETDLSLKQLSEHTNYSEEYLAKKFKKEMNISLNDYIRNAKIEHSKLLLSSTTESISVISERLHFCSASYYTKSFRTLTGITPQEYRKKNKN